MSKPFHSMLRHATASAVAAAGCESVHEMSIFVVWMAFWHEYFKCARRKRSKELVRVVEQDDGIMDVSLVHHNI
jgi:hypothetical protein